RTRLQGRVCRQVSSFQISLIRSGSRGVWRAAASARRRRLGRATGDSASRQERERQPVRRDARHRRDADVAPEPEHLKRRRAADRGGDHRPGTWGHGGEDRGDEERRDRGGAEALDRPGEAAAVRGRYAAEPGRQIPEEPRPQADGESDDDQLRPHAASVAARVLAAPPTTAPATIPARTPAVAPVVRATTAHVPPAATTTGTWRRSRIERSSARKSAGSMKPSAASTAGYAASAPPPGIAPGAVPSPQARNDETPIPSIHRSLQGLDPEARKPIVAAKTSS